jgi:hypothetical protein
MSQVVVEHRAEEKKDISGTTPHPRYRDRGKKKGLFAYKHMESFTDKLVGIYWKLLLAMPCFPSM